MSNNQEIHMSLPVGRVLVTPSEYFEVRETTIQLDGQRTTDYEGFKEKIRLDGIITPIKVKLIHNGKHEFLAADVLGCRTLLAFQELRDEIPETELTKSKWSKIPVHIERTLEYCTYWAEECLRWATSAPEGINPTAYNVVTLYSVPKAILEKLKKLYGPAAVHELSPGLLVVEMGGIYVRFSGWSHKWC